MSKLTFHNLRQLVPDMKIKGIEKEHFAFSYARQTIDCIFCFCGEHFELLVGVHVLNFGFVLTITRNYKGDYIAELTDDDYITFCNRLNLTYKNDGFTSNTLLKLLSSHVPIKSSGVNVTYETMRSYAHYYHVNEEDKIYFKGWNNHVRDNNIARNFDKTEFYFGKKVADYCRKNNISSIWTANPREQKMYHMPWNRQEK